LLRVVVEIVFIIVEVKLAIADQGGDFIRPSIAEIGADFIEALCIDIETAISGAAVDKKIGVSDRNFPLTPIKGSNQDSVLSPAGFNAGTCDLSLTSASISHQRTPAIRSTFMALFWRTLYV